MATTDLFRGETVRLAVEDPSVEAKVWSQWFRNSEFMLLMDTDPPILLSEKNIRDRLEKDLEEEHADVFYSMIRTIKDDRLIGFLALFKTFWNHGDAWVAIGLGEADCWGKGYGSEAMRLLLRYAFDELNLHRVTLGVFEYNSRAIRSYQKVGFVEEGRIRGEFLRQGKRWDMIFMGILREDWIKTNAEKTGVS
jgi:RimJ/RimL family protein N-acetyltransferase